MDWWSYRDRIALLVVVGAMLWLSWGFVARMGAAALVP